MLLCGFTISFRLKRQGIRLLFMEVIKLAADTEVVCFDKTGTLTGSVVSPPPARNTVFPHLTSTCRLNGFLDT